MTTLHEYTPVEIDVINDVIERIAQRKLEACADRVLDDLILRGRTTIEPVPEPTQDDVRAEVRRIVAAGPLAQQYDEDAERWDGQG